MRPSAALLYELFFSFQKKVDFFCVSIMTSWPQKNVQPYATIEKLKCLNAELHNRTFENWPWMTKLTISYWSRNPCDLAQHVRLCADIIGTDPAAADLANGDIGKKSSERHW
jgi:hypothetical protein